MMCTILHLLLVTSLLILQLESSHSIPSSTWRIHDVDGIQLQKRPQWGGGSRIINGLYRRGGSSNGPGGVGLSTYNDEGEQTNSNNDNDTSTNTTTSTSSVLSSLAGGQPLLYSTCSVQGERQYMEDEYFVEQEGRFAAVFDGHGGARVSKYLRQNLYANFQAALPISASMFTDEVDDDIEELGISVRDDAQSLTVASALETAFEKVDSEVGSISHWSFQGSTALAVVVHENANHTRSITVANVGDSRAVLSHNRIAVDLSKDHKPNDRIERQRIESLGGTVDWCGEVDPVNGLPIEHTGCYRINRNLALSRAIGDRSERPWVTNTADISHHLIDEEHDSFVVLATDGLFDVMTSQEVVTYVNDMVEDTSHDPETRHEIQRDIAKSIVDEALKRGTHDNVTVLVLWLDKKAD